MQARELLARAEGGGGSESEEEAPAAALGPTYAQEQDALRREFISAAAEAAEAAEGDEALLLPSAAARAVEAAPARKGKRGRGLTAADVFAAAPAPDADAGADAFLADYLTHRRWLAAGEGEGAGGESASEELERVEAFESNYNFRFEEPGGAALAAQPRRPDGLIRKQASARAEARKAKAERCVLLQRPGSVTLSRAGRRRAQRERGEAAPARGAEAVKDAEAQGAGGEACGGGARQRRGGRAAAAH